MSHAFPATIRPMKTASFLLVPAVVFFCPLLFAGPGDYGFANSKIEAPSLFLSNPSAPPRKSEIDSAFSFASGPNSLLQASPLVPPPVTFAAIEKIVLPNNRSFQSGPDRMPIMKPDPSVDFKLTAKDPDFRRDEGMIDGQPDLRPAQK